MFSVGKLLAYAFECRCFSITFGSFHRVIQTWTKQNKKTTTTTKTKKSKYFLILTLSNLCIMKSVLSSPNKIISHDTMTIYISFFYQGFFSRTLTTHSKGREDTIYHFHPLTNIQTIICNFAPEMTITYF